MKLNRYLGEVRKFEQQQPHIKTDIYNSIGDSQIKNKFRDRPYK